MRNHKADLSLDCGERVMGLKTRTVNVLSGWLGIDSRSAERYRRCTQVMSKLLLCCTGSECRAKEITVFFLSKHYFTAKVFSITAQTCLYPFELSRDFCITLKVTKLDQLVMQIRRNDQEKIDRALTLLERRHDQLNSAAFSPAGRIPGFSSG